MELLCNWQKAAAVFINKYLSFLFTKRDSLAASCVLALAATVGSWLVPGYEKFLQL